MKTLPTCLFLPIVLMACKKEQLSYEGTQVRNMPLREAKQLLTGKWQIHYRYGGITGRMKTDLLDSYLTVRSNDSIYLTFGNTLYAADLARFERRKTANFSWSTCIIDFEALGCSGHSWMVDEKRGDTLVLVDDGTNPDTYIMTKIGQ